MAKIYVASSWRNQYFPDVVKKLREYGHEVYDFRNPPHNHGAFMWKDVDPDFDKWTVEEYKQGLQHPSSERQFQADLDALHWSDTCLLVLLCGRSAHPEAECTSLLNLWYLSDNQSKNGTHWCRF